MTLKRFIQTTLSIFAIVSLSGCIQGGLLGNLFFDDLESPDQVGQGKFAVGDVVSIVITPNDGVSLEGLKAVSSDTNILLVDPNLSNNSNNSITLLGEIVGDGSADIQIFDDNGVLVDIITLNTGVAADLLLQPVQFGLESGKTLDNITIFQDGTVEMLSQLQEDVAGTLVPLKGQIQGEASTQNTGNVGIVETQQAFLLGEAFEGNLDVVPLSFFNLLGENVGTDTVTFAANGFTKDLLVDTFPLDPNLFELAIIAPDTELAPVNSGLLSAQSFSLDNGEEIFGGNYVFVEIIDEQDLLDIVPLSEDAAVFSARAAGTASVEILLLDKAGDIVTSVFVDINVTP